jgi:hypothetical protein
MKDAAEMLQEYWARETYEGCNGYTKNASTIDQIASFAESTAARDPGYDIEVGMPLFDPSQKRSEDNLEGPAPPLHMAESTKTKRQLFQAQIRKNRHFSDSRRVFI